MTPAATISDPQAFLRALFDAAVERAQPAHSLAPFLPAPPHGRTVVVGAGKAGGAMAAAVEALWPADAPLSGLVVTRYGHVPPDHQSQPRRIELIEAAHPVPDAAGQQAAARIAKQVQGLGPDDLVLALISGGGSALLAQPAAGLTLADKQAINQALLRSGAAIDEMNCVRKHLSAIKGGRLAAACYPAKVVTLRPRPRMTGGPSDQVGMGAIGIHPGSATGAGAATGVGAATVRRLAAPGVAVLSTVSYLDTSTVTTGADTTSGTHVEFSARGIATATSFSTNERSTLANSFSRISRPSPANCFWAAALVARAALRAGAAFAVHGGHGLQGALGVFDHQQVLRQVEGVAPVHHGAE